MERRSRRERPTDCGRGGGRLLAVVEADGVVRYAHSDEQGRVVALTDAAGTVTDQFCYGPYGTDWGRSGTNSIPFRWLGSHGVLAAVSLFPASGSSPQTLPSSLYVTRHRAYDAALGRFLSADPLGLGGGPNVYAYCLGNPLAYIDPLGLCGDQTFGFGVGDYWEDVKAFSRGVDIAAYSILQGLADFVMSPSQSTMAFMNEIADLESYTRNMVDSVSEQWNSGPEGQGAIVGSALITAGTALAPFASAASGVGAVGKVSSIAKSVPTGKLPGPTVDPVTGIPVGRFIGSKRGAPMIEPVGGTTKGYPKETSVDTHTFYPNGSNYQRLNPEGHGTNPTPHGHAHAEGTGPGRVGQGASLDIYGNEVPNNSAAAHWPL